MITTTARRLLVGGCVLGLAAALSCLATPGTVGAALAKNSALGRQVTRIITTSNAGVQRAKLTTDWSGNVGSIEWWFMYAANKLETLFGSNAVPITAPPVDTGGTCTIKPPPNDYTFGGCVITKRIKIAGRKLEATLLALALDATTFEIVVKGLDTIKSGAASTTAKEVVLAATSVKDLAKFKRDEKAELKASDALRRLIGLPPAKS